MSNRPLRLPGLESRRCRFPHLLVRVQQKQHPADQIVRQQVEASWRLIFDKSLEGSAYPAFALDEAPPGMSDLISRIVLTRSHRCQVHYNCERQQHYCMQPMGAYPYIVLSHPTLQLTVIGKITRPNQPDCHTRVGAYTLLKCWKRGRGQSVIYMKNLSIRIPDSGGQPQRVSWVRAEVGRDSETKHQDIP